ncbi:protein YIPF3-like isoform X1 [Haliotis cracherodii]|uniref:protein YIPF3-like isoform X1 n=1 Tax=Haliotis cracherodii TaxID=6455 RepID=UPI0039EA0918
MADSSPWQAGQQADMNQGSAVLEMEGVEMTDEDGDASDYENNMSGPQSGGDKEGKFMDDVRQRVGQNVTQMMWNAGRQSAQKAWSIYGNIDILRPYFDVEPKEVQRRLLFSMIPQKPTSQRQRIQKELYGPLMVIFTMIALLLYQMKVSSHSVEEGTLMGTAFVVCFSYWFGTSSFIWFLSYVCNVRIAMVQVLSMVGYGLFGHCVVLFLGTVIHTTHDHMFFYLLWAIVGGLSALKMACIIMSRASGKTERLIVIVVLASLHLLFLLYLHFAYHSVVEEMSAMFEDHRHEPIQPVVAQRIAEQGLDRKVENAAANVMEKVTQKIAAAFQQRGQLVAESMGKSVNSSAVKRVLRETLRGVQTDRIVPFVTKTLNGSHVMAGNASRIM